MLNLNICYVNIFEKAKRNDLGGGGGGVGMILLLFFLNLFLQRNLLIAEQLWNI